MPECRAFRKQWPEFLGGEFEAAERERLERHLAGCPACRARYQEIKETLMLAQRRKKPDPGQAFWDGYWDRLQARISGESFPSPASIPARPEPRRGFRVFRWVAIPAAAAALLVAGIFIGRFGSRLPSPPAGESGDVVQAAELAGRTALYFKRSERILLALVNFQPGSEDVYGLDLPGRKIASEKLAREASALRSDLTAARERRLEKLVGDLQRILLQIANLEAADNLAAVDIIKSGVEARDILFQINLAGMRGPTASPDLSQTEKGRLRRPQGART